MRIAFFVPIFPVISETFIVRQITGMIDRGYEVAIHTGCRGNTSVVHEEVRKYALLERTNYAGTMPRSKLGRFTGLLGQLARNTGPMRKAQLRALNPARFGLMPKIWLPFMAPSWVGRDYDVVHVHFGPLGLQALQLREVCGFSAKIVVTLHGYDMSSYIKNNGPTAYDELFKKADLLLPISERWKRSLEEMGCPPEKLRVHRMGIDCERFGFVPRNVRCGDTVRLISVARLVEKKGLEYMISALEMVVKKFPRVRYDIIGDGPLRGALERRIGELELQQQVSLLGALPNEKVRRELYASHIFVCPSVTAANGDQEGIPVVLMEAMATGMPVVATHHSGIPELVEDGVSGMLVEERDVAGLADAVLRLLERPEEWATMGQAGQAAVVKNYNSAKLNDELVIIFKDLLQSSDNRRVY